MGEFGDQERHTVVGRGSSAGIGGPRAGCSRSSCEKGGLMRWACVGIRRWDGRADQNGNDGRWAGVGME